MKGKNTFLILSAIILIIAIFLFFSINAIIKLKSTQTSSSEISEEHVIYFSENLQKHILDKGLIPIEGFTPQIYLQYYSNLKSEDFNNVEAELGIYKYQNSDLTFVDTTRPGEPIHSAYDTISNFGYKTLLDNISNRLNIEIKDTISIDDLINKL